MTASAAAILTAAGSGSRLGLGYPKALAELAACSLVGHAASRLSASGEVSRIVVTAPSEHVDALEDALRATPGLTVAWSVVVGGASRQASVAAGLAELAAQADPAHPFDVVLVHDAARPLAPVELVRRVVDAVRAGHGAVVPALPVTDSITTVHTGTAAAASPATGSDASGTGPAVRPELSGGAVDRTLLRAVQTPQGFTWDVLQRAHAAGAHRAADEATAATDDSALVSALGEPVWIVAGDPAALKVTTSHDLAVAEVLLAREASTDHPTTDHPPTDHPPTDHPTAGGPGPRTLEEPA